MTAKPKLDVKITQYVIFSLNALQNSHLPMLDTTTKMKWVEKKQIMGQYEMHTYIMIPASSIVYAIRHNIVILYLPWVEELMVRVLAKA